MIESELRPWLENDRQQGNMPVTFTLQRTMSVLLAGALVLVGASCVTARPPSRQEVLQKILQTEPDRLLPTLTVESWRLRDLVVAFLVPSIPARALRPGMTPERAADYVARMLLSFISAPGRWDLSDPVQVRELVRTELLAGVLSPEALRGA